MPGELRNDLNGLRIKLPGHAAVYLMDLGKKRHIPNPVVYNELFSTWKGIVEDINVDAIPTGDPIPETAILFRCIDSPRVFLYDVEHSNQVKRHVTSPPVMDRYCFNWHRIHLWNVPLDMIGIEDGSKIENP